MPLRRLLDALPPLADDEELVCELQEQEQANH